MSGLPGRVDLGVRSTPVFKAFDLKPNLWIKDDGCSAPGYGGNKPRKLEYLLYEAPRRIVTMGAQGSHHALATAVHGSRLGHDVHVIAFPRPENEHVGAVFEATAALATVHMASDQDAACELLSSLAQDALAIPAGGSSPVGAQGFIRAGRELVSQIRDGVLPQPRRVYAAMGTAGTVVGLAIALEEAGFSTEVIGVRVVPEDWLSLADVEALSQEAAALAGLDPAMPVCVEDQLGEGYGMPTEAAESAVEAAARLDSCGCRLETTYTGKALAAALADESDEPMLYWQTHNAHSISDIAEAV
ncbi:MAG: pyridoxal-phosphate dependent enzyme [Phycisphaerales bacterium]|nr:pyridoxal-phosphate dependent enzyme [Phycisphaerales bacterium]